MKYSKAMLLLLLMCTLNGCFLTKVVTVPMRVTGAVLSVIPGAGNIIDEGIDSTADIIDEVPL